MANLPGTLTDILTHNSTPDSHSWNSERIRWGDPSKIYGIFLSNDTNNGIVYVDKDTITADDKPIETHLELSEALGVYVYRLTKTTNPGIPIKFYPKYVESDYKNLSKVEDQLEIWHRKKYRAGRIWKHDDKTYIVCFWCEEKDIDKKYLDTILAAFKIKSIYWSAIDSKYYYKYSKGEKSVAKKSSKVLKSMVAPSLTQRQIIDILVKAHTDPNKLTAIEKKVVDEFRGSKEYADAAKGMGGYDIAAKYHYYSRTSEDCDTVSFKDFIIEEALNYMFR